jgi:hypothetical protein
MESAYPAISVLVFLTCFRLARCLNPQARTMLCTRNYFQCIEACHEN